MLILAGRLCTVTLSVIYYFARQMVGWLVGSCLLIFIIIYSLSSFFSFFSLENEFKSLKNLFFSFSRILNRPSDYYHHQKPCSMHNLSSPLPTLRPITFPMCVEIDVLFSIKDLPQRHAPYSKYFVFISYHKQENSTLLLLLLFGTRRR